MSICKPHWDKLRVAIEHRGMSHLVAKSGQEAMNNIKAELDGTKKKGDYDPLMDCNNMIWSRGLECGGLRMLSGDICPICEATKHDEKETVWIDGPADAALAHCRELGLMPKVQ